MKKTLVSVILILVLLVTMTACGISKEACESCGKDAVEVYILTEQPAVINAAVADATKPLLDQLAEIPHNPTESELNDLVEKWNDSPPSDDLVDFINFSIENMLECHVCMITLDVNSTIRRFLVTFAVNGDNWTFYYFSPQNKLIKTCPVVGEKWEGYPYIVNPVVVQIKIAK
jgi:hypothetical protein